MSALRGTIQTLILVAATGIGLAAESHFARADYYNGDSYGGGGGYNSYGYGGGGGGYNNYGGSYGGSGTSAIISLELNEKESLNSSLRVAAREDRLADLKRMISQGGDINSQSDAGDTALIYASRNCSNKIVQYLLSLRNADGNARVNVNIRDRLGRTAIMYAASDSCAPVVKNLLELPNIELGIKDRDGRTIRDYALYGAELEMGGPASETYALIRSAERAARGRRERLARSNLR